MRSSLLLPLICTSFGSRLNNRRLVFGFPHWSQPFGHSVCEASLFLRYVKAPSRSQAAPCHEGLPVTADTVGVIMPPQADPLAASREGCSMVQLMQAYRSWILAQHIEGCTLSEGSDDNVVISGDLVKGWVNFYDIDGACIVELRLERVLDGEPAFFLHFELEDIVRAEKLFGEMAEAIHDATHREIRHVLLCCSCGMTTTFFAMKQRPCAPPRHSRQRRRAHPVGVLGRRQPRPRRARRPDTRVKQGRRLACAPSCKPIGTRLTTRGRANRSPRAAPRCAPGSAPTRAWRGRCPAGRVPPDGAPGAPCP